MSRIGKQPVTIPSGVTLTQNGQVITVKGSKGELSFTMPHNVSGKLDGDSFTVTPNDETKTSRGMWGMSRTMVANLIEGVTNGYKKELELKGVGYRAQMKGTSLTMQLGFSHDVITHRLRVLKLKRQSQPLLLCQVWTNKKLVKSPLRSAHTVNLNLIKVRACAMLVNMSV